MGKIQGPEFYTGQGYLKENFDKNLYQKASNLLPSVDDIKKNFIYEFGCGVGYFAKEIYDRGYKKYIGFDFSEKALDHFVDLIPDYYFVFQNKIKPIKKNYQNLTMPSITEFESSPFGIVVEFDLDKYYKNLIDHFKIMSYVVALEFFEHIKNDLEIIDLMKKGTNLIFSVPNKDYISHIRHFERIEDVYNRYDKLLDFTSVEEIISERKKSNKTYLCKCVKKSEMGELFFENSNIES